MFCSLCDSILGTEVLKEHDLPHVKTETRDNSKCEKRYEWSSCEQHDARSLVESAAKKQDGELVLSAQGDI